MANLVFTAALVVGQRPALRGSGLGAQALTAGLVVYRDGQLGWKPAAAGASTTRARTPQGLALNAAGADQPFVVQRRGVVDFGSNVLTPGAVYYLSPTAGKLCPLADLTEDDAIIAVGMAFSARLFNINILPLSFGAGAVDAAPVNTLLPSIIGDAVVGETLSVDLGEWDNSPTSYAVQWKLGGVAISGETDDDYLVDDADEGGVITVTVTATNSIGSTSATSLGTDAVTADGEPWVLLSGAWDDAAPWDDTQLWKDAA